MVGEVRKVGDRRSRTFLYVREGIKVRQAKGHNWSRKIKGVSRTLALEGPFGIVDSTLYIDG